jgi:ABC-type transport system involved in multi-copper enzyme maturation permease subunit
MKYLAILKDSLREAWDSWVLLGLFALSTLAIIFVAQLSFKPQTAEKTMAYFFVSTPFEQRPVMVDALNNRKPEKILTRGGWRNFRLQKVELLRGEPDSPLSDYALTVSSGGRNFDHFDAPMPPVEAKADQPEGKKPEVDHKAEIAQLRKHFEDAEELGFIKIASIEPEKGEGQGPQPYRVILHGTPTTHRIWGTEPGVAFGLVRHEIFEFFADPLCWRLYKLAHIVIGFGSWVAVLLGVVITSFFFPNMLRKGTIDLLLVKPINRWLLLTYKYLGGLTFIFLTTAYAIGGIWFVLGLRSGLWANGALLLIPSITFFFGILYAVSTFVGVVTRSVVASILLTIGAWVIFFAIGQVHAFVDLGEKLEKEEDKRREIMKQPPRPDEDRWTGGWTFTIIKLLHTVAPRTEDLNQLNDLIIYTDFMTGSLGDMGKFDQSRRNWWEALLVSGIWIAIFMGLAALWFYFKDY